MITFPFSKSGFASKTFRAKPDLEKGKAGCGWRLPRAAVAALLCPDTLSKVIHSRAEGARQAKRSEAVNNFAGMNFESNLRSEHNGSGRKAPGRTRSSCPDPTRIEPRTPADPGAFVKKSERTTPCEGPRIRTTHDKGLGPRARKKMTEQIEWEKITHYAGFDWAKDHHDVVVVNQQ